MSPNGSERSTLANELISASNPGGGWSYYPGKASRLEPTTWSLLALARNRTVPSAFDPSRHRDFLAGCQRPDGWVVENTSWPVNVAFNALVAFVWLTRPELADHNRVDPLVNALVRSKGVQVPPSPSLAQDNSLQGWSWNLDTFSWVEPTAWGVLALKKAVRSGVLNEASAAPRIQEGERLLIDRCCRGGGWNFGNPNVLGNDLYPHAPTTAIALLALQDQPQHAVVARSLTFLEKQWREEQSLLALGLSLICLTSHGRSIVDLEDKLRAHVTAQSSSPSTSPHTETRLPSNSLHGSAVALCALSLNDNEGAFRI